MRLGHIPTAAELLLVYVLFSTLPFRGYRILGYISAELLLLSRGQEEILPLERDDSTFVYKMMDVFLRLYLS